MCLREIECVVEHTQARVEFASLTFGEDLAEEGPDIGLGTKEFAAFSGAMDLVDNAPGKELAQVHGDIAARDAQPMT